MAAPYFVPKAYNVRSGTTDLGREYEYNMIALLCARCIAQNVEDMWIVSNCDQVGAFDDVILHVVQPGGNSATFMIQLKHKAKPTNITKEEFVPVKNPNAKKQPKGDFFLEKYLKDIKDLKRKIESRVGGVVADMGAFSDVQFAIFTNRDVFAYDFLESVRPSALLNTNNAEVYTFDFGKLSLLDPFFNDSDCVTNLFLYPKQLNVTAVAKDIVGAIKNIFGALGVKLVNAENIAREFMLYVTSWAKGDLGKHYYLAKHEVVGKLCELFFRQFEVNLSLQRFTYYDCPKKFIWNEVIRDQDLVLVDADDLALQFLMDYLGSEVRMVCNQGRLDNWLDAIATEDESLFYQPGNEELKWQLLKVVGKHKRVNVLEVYRTLVLTKKVPLVLKINNLEEYENVLRVLPVSDFKIIIVNSAGSLKQPGNIKTFGTLQDLPQESRRKILELPIKLQGRNTILGKLVNENISKLIKCKDVINILLGNFNIGNEFPALPPYFVERSIAKVLIDSKILQNNLDDIILIEENGGNLPALKLEEIDFKSAKGAIRTTGLKYITREQKQIIMDSGGRNVHYFKVDDAHHFEWKWSLGSIEPLIPFVTQTLEGLDDSLDDYFNNDLNVISASPGMGKTLFMDYLAHHAPESSWVLRINLNTCQFRQYYSSTNQTEALAHLRFFNAQLDENKSALAHAVFEKLLRKKKTMVILDGFDEVSFSFTEEVTKIAKSIQRDGFPLWITTRPQGKAHLQNEFNTLALNLNPFDLDDQFFFLKRYFGVLNPGLVFPTSLLEGFIAELLQTAQKNLQDRDAEFAGIPLQCQILAEVFNEQCVEYVKNNGEVKFGEDFDLLGLYEKMINKKMRIVCEKFGAGSTEMYGRFKHVQSLLAFKFLFPFKCAEGSYVQEELREFSGKDLQLIQIDGIMSVDGNQNISCVHRTFAEYLTAQFVVKNLKNKHERVWEILRFILSARFFSVHGFLFEMFDRMVVAEASLPLRSLHSAIRQRDVTGAKSIIRADPNVLNEYDAFGRSILHIVALNAAEFPFPYDPKYATMRKYKFDTIPTILEEIPDACFKIVKLDPLGLSPFDYALSNSSLHLAKLICDRAKPLTTNAIVRLTEISEISHDFLRYCIDLHFKPLIRIFIPYCAAKLSLFVPGAATHLLKVHFDPNLITKYNQGSNLNELISPDLTCLKLLQSGSFAAYSGYANNSYSKLCYAIVFGSNSNVENLLLANLDVNKTFFNLFTPLSCAALHGKAQIIDALLLRGAKPNLQDFYGFTALSYAIRGYRFTHAKLYYEIITKLLRFGCNVNTQDLTGFTCLHELLNIYNENHTSLFTIPYVNKSKMEAVQFLKLLVDTGADVNLGDRFGCTPLHVATQNLLTNCVEFLIKEDANVNQIDINGTTALLTVLAKGVLLLGTKHKPHWYVSNLPWFNKQTEKITKILLENGANINHQSCDGETALHIAVIASMIPGFLDIKLLLEHGADVNIRMYNNGLKPLHIAMLSLNQPLTLDLNVYKSLIEKDGDVNAQNSDGNTALHLILRGASPEKTYPVIAMLLRKGADVNVRNNVEKSALEVLQENNFEITRPLRFPKNPRRKDQEAVPKYSSQFLLLAAMYLIAYYFIVENNPIVVLVFLWFYRYSAC